MEFIEITHGKQRVEEVAFPPRLEDVLIWSNTFRCVGTFCNYLGHLRGACYALSIEAPPVGHPALRRAMASIAKRQLYTERRVGFQVSVVMLVLGCCPRPRLFIQRCMLRNMMAAKQSEDGGAAHAALWLIAYLFLLRVPSEAGAFAASWQPCAVFSPCSGVASPCCCFR